jgi:hypothetical protein
MRFSYSGLFKTRESAETALIAYMANGEILEGEHPEIVRRLCRIGGKICERFFIEIDG